MRINTIRLRTMLGWLGMLLSWIVAALVGYIPQSISATWYTNACTVFMIILGSSSILLMSYKGYDWLDDLINEETNIEYSTIDGLYINKEKVGYIYNLYITNTQEKVKL